MSARFKLLPPTRADGNCPLTYRCEECRQEVVNRGDSLKIHAKLHGKKHYVCDHSHFYTYYNHVKKEADNDDEHAAS